MAGYQPLKITNYQTGLVTNREEMILPDDAYPVLQNAYIFREGIRRKSGFSLLGRLRLKIGTTDAMGNFAYTINSTSAGAQKVQYGISSFSVGDNVYTDPYDTAQAEPVNLLVSGVGTATLNRTTGALTITGSTALTDVWYYPGLPVMGICKKEQTDSSTWFTIFFDQVYAYQLNSGTGMFEEFIMGEKWNKAGKDVTGINFFWGTNYWISTTTVFPGNENKKVFWVTNDSGGSFPNADPPRLTEGTVWADFYDYATPANTPWAQIDATSYLQNWRCMLPFRGRMVVFNTWEGDAGSSINFYNRIRWSTIGNPFIAYTAGPPAAGSWRDDIRGQGGFLDIPTNEDIVSIGYVRDNLIIYCQRSTWQLRYTGNSIAPFQIEKVNSELGCESVLSAVQFDTSLIGIGDKGIVECDSYKSNRIDVKIVDFVYDINFQNNGTYRCQGIRDFQNKLAYWTVCYIPYYDQNIGQTNWVFPNIRLIYNYENDSWSIFNDSLTTLGLFQVQSSRTWLSTPIPWIECNFTWLDNPIGDPVIVGGNQQGFIEQLDTTTYNDVSLFVTNIQGFNSSPTIVTSTNHNMQTGTIIQFTGITGTFSILNGLNFKVVTIANDPNKFYLYEFNDDNQTFSDPRVEGTTSLTYTGNGLIRIRENFSIKSKKFNFLDEGQSIQIGYLDVLMQATGAPNEGEISMYIYLDYDDENKSNQFPANQSADTFFNTTVPTYPSTLTQAPEGSKFWQRVFCPTRANFITIEYTFSDAQLNDIDQQLPVRIDAQVLWMRKAGRMTNL